MKTLAAILVETGKPLELCELEIPRLKSGQALVEVAFSGVCHTQVLEARGYRGEDKFLPHCLGHEGSGTVREVGRGMTKVKPGDQVILSWIKGSGADVAGTTYQWNGRMVNAGGITTFSEFSVISENRLTRIPDKLPLRDAALVGCAVPTGAGVIFNTLCAQAGQSIVIFGVGGIGLCAVAAAAVAGSAPIIAVDIQPQKLDAAQALGATHVIAASEPLAQILAICPQGVDFAVEATGRPSVMALALRCVRSQGGVAVIIGNARHGEALTLDPRELNQGKRLLGTWGGDNQPDRDFPRYCELVANGRFPLVPLVSAPYRLADINRALDDLETGKTIRPLVEP